MEKQPLAGVQSSAVCGHYKQYPYVHSVHSHSYLEEGQDQKQVLQSSPQKASIALLVEYSRLLPEPPK